MRNVGKSVSTLMVLIVLVVVVTTQGKPESTVPRCQLGTVNIPASAKECARIKTARIPYVEKTDD